MKHKNKKRAQFKWVRRLHPLPASSFQWAGLQRANQHKVFDFQWYIAMPQGNCCYDKFSQNKETINFSSVAYM